MCVSSVWQFYIKLSEEEKNRKLNELLDALEFNQVTGAPRDPLTCMQRQRSLLAVVVRSPGRDLRLEGEPRHGSQQAVGRLQLPVHLHPRRHEPGREASSSTADWGF